MSDIEFLFLNLDYAEENEYDELKGRIQWMGENVVIVYFLNLDYAEEDEEDEFKRPHSQKVGYVVS